MKPLFLSIDFDFFVIEKNEWDFGHAESLFFIRDMWPIRVSNHIVGSEDLTQQCKLAGCPPAVPDFWSTLKCAGYRFTPKTTLVVDETHVGAYEAFSIAAKRLRTRSFDVVHFDAHADIGYDSYISVVASMVKNKKVDCGNWLLGLAMQYQVDLTIVYPAWKGLEEWNSNFKDSDKIVKAFASCKPTVYDEKRIALQEPRDVDAIFICRSGAWVPPWVDKDFTRFVNECPVLLKRRKVHDRGINPLEPRPYDHEEVMAQRKVLKEQFDALMKKQAL